ncbi:aminopeptidase, partial [Clostridioides difficile]|uniref:aminopeptidase n=1 Tax=Clostridioides difficile TaxID=1496 RepID=UPI001F2B89D0
DKGCINYINQYSNINNSKKSDSSTKIDKDLPLDILVERGLKDWAKKVFPNLSEDKAIEKLWDAIFKCSRVDGQDPIKAWEEH